MKKLCIMLLFVPLAVPIFADRVIDLGLGRDEKVAGCFGESDGRGHYAFAVKIKKNRPVLAKGRYYLYTEKGRKGPFEDISQPELSSDGESVAYWVKSDGKKSIYFGETMAGAFQDAMYAGFQKTTGTRIFLYKKDGLWYFNVADTVYGPFDYPPNYPKFSPDGKSFAWTDYKNGRVYVYVNGKQWRDFQNVENIWFPVGSTEPYCAAQMDGRWYFFGENEQVGPFDKIHVYQLFYDGRHPLCQVWDKRGVFIFDGTKKIGPFEEILDYNLVDDTGVYIIENQMQYSGGLYDNWRKYYIIKDGRIFLRE